MATVKINRELLSDLLDTLSDYHVMRCRCTHEQPCVVRQRVERGKGLLLRTPVCSDTPQPPPPAILLEDR